jgi:hypothetical protein
MIGRRDEDLLIWFFEEGIGAFWRSPLGSALERQSALAYDGEGHRVPKPAPWTLAATIAYRHRASEASYMPDEDLLLRAASVSRRLRRVAESDARAAQTLEVYYGGIGARFAPGKEGRLFALYPLTDAGAHLCQDESARDATRALLPHERIARAIEEQRRRPTDERRDLLARVRAQAERRLTDAWRAWQATGDRAPVARGRA